MNHRSMLLSSEAVFSKVEALGVAVPDNPPLGLYVPRFTGEIASIQLFLVDNLGIQAFLDINYQYREIQIGR